MSGMDSDMWMSAFGDGVVSGTAERGSTITGSEIVTISRGFATESRGWSTVRSVIDVGLIFFLGLETSGVGTGS